MATRRPLVSVNGQIAEMPSGDILAGDTYSASGGFQQIFVQETQPTLVAGQPFTWYQTGVDGTVQDIYLFDGVI
jgi:hypothetical protein